MERRISNSNDNWIHSNGNGNARVSLHRFDGRRDLLRRTSLHHRPHRVGAFRAQILRSNLQHSDPQPPDRFVPVLGATRRVPLRHGGDTDPGRWEHVHRRALLQNCVRCDGFSLCDWVCFGHLVGV